MNDPAPDDRTDATTSEHTATMDFYGYWIWRAPDGSTTWDDLHDAEAFPPSDGWDLVTMRPSDGSYPDTDTLETLAHNTLHGDVQDAFDVGTLHVLLVGRGDPTEARVHPFDPEAVLEDAETVLEGWDA